MKPRTLIAVQFSLWAFFFSGIIPFAGDFLLPIVWIYDRRVFTGFVATELIITIRILPIAISLVPLDKLAQIPTWSIPWLGPFTLGWIAISMVFTTWTGAFWLKRRMKKVAPDLTRFHFK